MQTDTVQFFGSLQSPYCYFGLDRIILLSRDLGVTVTMRSVLPGVVRIPDAFADRSKMEIDYFQTDVERTAEFLGLPFFAPQPSPVNWREGAGWIAEREQVRVFRLYNMLFHAYGLSREFQLYTAFMRLIWSSGIPDWDKPEYLSACLAECDLPESILQQPDMLAPEAEEYFTANQQAMNNCGHWGVPMFCWRREPFYGQDRLDQLRWRIENCANSPK